MDSAKKWAHNESYFFSALFFFYLFISFWLPVTQPSGCCADGDEAQKPNVNSKFFVIFLWSIEALVWFATNKKDRIGHDTGYFVLVFCCSSTLGCEDAFWMSLIFVALFCSLNKYELLFAALFVLEKSKKKTSKSRRQHQRRPNGGTLGFEMVFQIQISRISA